MLNANHKPNQNDFIPIETKGVHVNLACVTLKNM